MIMPSGGKGFVVVTGLHAADNPSPGHGIAKCLVSSGYEVAGLCFTATETGVYSNEVFKRVYLMPEIQKDPRGYLNRLKEVMRDCNASILIPNLDPEVVFLSEHLEKLKRAGIRCLIPDISVLSQVIKTSLEIIGRKCGFRVLKSHPIYSLKAAREVVRNLGLPIMIKGAWYEAHTIEHMDEIPFFFRKLKQRWDLPVILQQKGGGFEAVVACLCDRPGNIARSISLRKIGMTDQGTTWCGVTFHNSDLLELCRKLISRLGWVGPCEVEVLIDENSGMFTLLEFNTRFPSWIGFSAEVGNNLPLDLVHILEEKILKKKSMVAGGQMMIRQFHDRVAPLSRLMQLEVQGMISEESKN